MAYWLIKSDPEEYSWDDFNRDSITNWTGIRNFQARNNLALMNLGDTILFYHSKTGKNIVGLAEVTKTSFPDPTASGEEWLAVEIAPLRSIRKAVSLEQIKDHPKLAEIPLVRQQRLSVIPITEEEFKTIIELSK